MSSSSSSSAARSARAALTRGDVAAAHRHYAKAAAAADEDLFLEWCAAHADRGDHTSAERVLRQGLQRFPTSRPLLLRYAVLQRDFDQRDDAALILKHILTGAPQDADALRLAGLVDFERGQDARQLYRQAMAVHPHHPQTALGAASALNAAGDTDQAIDLLSNFVRQAPHWLEGLRALARLRWDRGDGEAYIDDLEQPLQLRPRDLTLWGACLGILASGLQFDVVLEKLPKARASAGNLQLFDMFEAQALSETGQTEAAEPLFRALEPITDVTFAVTRLRSLLRTARVTEAARLGEQFASGPRGNVIWPLLGLAWRATDDPRWKWLERFDDCVAVVDLPIGEDELGGIADCVRRLHRSRAAPFDQSARGGTQTLGNIFERTDPPITHLRETVRNAVRIYIDGLPGIDLAHPFLGRHRGPFRFAGSWSIKLSGQGHHVSHVHPSGWISSALYLSLPDLDAEPGPRAGWLGLGGAPPELQLGLEPLKWVEPKAGRLALFPSIMWHGTEPFRSGERLTVAFDVVPFN